jgi:hypothetical protein
LYTSKVTGKQYKIFCTVNCKRGSHGRLRKDFGQFEFFFDGCPMSTNGVEAVSQTGMVCEDTKPNTTIGKSHSCGEKHSKCCRHMQRSSLYTSKVTGKQYKIFCTVNCKSANIITPQTVLFNDEDVHSVKILETVVRQSEVLAHRKK